MFVYILDISGIYRGIWHCNLGLLLGRGCCLFNVGQRTWCRSEHRIRHLTPWRRKLDLGIIVESQRYVGYKGIHWTENAAFPTVGCIWLLLRAMSWGTKYSQIMWHIQFNWQDSTTGYRVQIIWCRMQVAAILCKYEASPLGPTYRTLKVNLGRDV